MEMQQINAMEQNGTFHSATLEINNNRAVRSDCHLGDKILRKENTDFHKTW